MSFFLTINFFSSIFLLLILILLIGKADNRKVTQSTSLYTTRTFRIVPPTTTKRPNWVQSKVSRVRDWIRRPKTTTPRPNFNSNWNTAATTKKSSFFERAKDKINRSGIVGKAVGFVKKDLGIGVVGPKQESKILKYGGKAVQKLFGKTAPSAAVGAAAGAAAGTAAGAGAAAMRDRSMQGPIPSINPSTPSMQVSADAVEWPKNSDQEAEILLFENLTSEWSTSEAGSKYKLFEVPKKWDDAKDHCDSFGANLAILEGEAQNDFATELLQSSNSTSAAWIGLQTSIGTQKTQGFNNFQDTNIDGCGIIDTNGTWSISSCILTLPYICQQLKTGGFVTIP